MTKIQSEAAYRTAMERIEELLPLVTDETPITDKNAVELDILSALVSDYEDEHYPIGVPSLIDVIKLRMYEMNLTQKSLAELIGVSPSRVSEYLKGKCEPTLKVARSISMALHIEPSIVLGIS